MLSALAARGAAAGVKAADRAREQLAQALHETLPGAAVTIEGEEIVLAGRIAADDPRLRWIGSLIA